MFDGLKTVKSSNSPMETAKELLTLDDIEGRTIIELKQIRFIMSLKRKVQTLKPYYKDSEDKHIYNKLDSVDQEIEYFLQIITSVKGKSREQFVNALQALIQNIGQESLANTIGIGGRK